MNETKDRRRAGLRCCRIAHTEAVEDYLKTIFALSSRSSAVTTSAVAGHLGVAAPTVSAMLKRLEANQLVRRTNDHQIGLTDHGKRHALGVVRRHRLIEVFLADVLSVPWDEVHAEAEVLEHAISARLEERIDTFLDHPTHDPHGDPIPDVDLHIDEGSSHALETLESGASGRFVRVSDSDPAMLRYLDERGIDIGDQLEVLERQPFDGPLTVRFGDADQVLGGTLARAMRIEIEADLQRKGTITGE